MFCLRESTGSWIHANWRRYWNREAISFTEDHHNSYRNSWGMIVWVFILCVGVEVCQCQVDIVDNLSRICEQNDVFFLSAGLNHSAWPGRQVELVS